MLYHDRCLARILCNSTSIDKNVVKKRIIRIYYIFYQAITVYIENGPDVTGLRLEHLTVQSCTCVTETGVRFVLQNYRYRILVSGTARINTSIIHIQFLA